MRESRRTFISVVGLNEKGECTTCGTDAHFKHAHLMQQRPASPGATPDALAANARRFIWRGDIRSIHVEAANPARTDGAVFYRTLNADGSADEWQSVPVFKSESWRFIIAKSAPEHIGVEICTSENLKTNLHEVFDRAHFPTVELAESERGSDVTPLPQYPGRKVVAAERT